MNDTAVSLIAKPHYKDPLAAAWMAKYHSMRFLKWKWSDLSFQFIPSGRDKDPDSSKLYIHPDSLHLLEPQDLDLLFRTNGFCQTVGVHIGIPKTKAQIEAGGCIIQRNGKSFIWPEEA